MASWRNNNNNTPPQHSLPARPPPSTYSAPPPRPASTFNNSYATPSAYGAYAPRAPAGPPQAYAAPTNYSQPALSAPYQANAYPTSNAYSDYSYPAYTAQNAGYQGAAYQGAASMNRGPAGTHDPEEEARIAEWNSAYTRDDGKKGGGGLAGTRTDAASTPVADTALQAEGKRKTVIREAGGKKWEDASLLEWDPMHPRLFIGNLAGEVQDDVLFKAFSHYPSLVKAHVVRDKRTTKSKSYGFVSFRDTDDYFRAAKEMQGKYIGSHPVLIKRANTDMKIVTKRDDALNKYNKNNKQKNNKDNKAATNSTTTAGTSAMFVPRGVQKKTKAKKILG